MNTNQRNNLLFQMLETELGGVHIYKTATRCASNPDLKKEYTKYLKQTEHHVEIVTQLILAVDLDPETETPGRKIVRCIGDALVEAMELALDEGDKKAAQLVAAGCVTLAETKDHLNWELLAEYTKKVRGEEKAVFKKACEKVLEQENEHLFHSRGFCRELWMESLGLDAVIPPPEERRKAKTELGAVRAKEHRRSMI